MTSTGAAINAEIMTQITLRNDSVCELPVMHYPCYFGTQTGANFRVIAKAFRELPRLRRHYQARHAGKLAGPYHPPKMPDAAEA